MSYNKVLITITNQTVAQKYYAKSYPSRDRNYDSREDKYEVPVYKVLLSTTNQLGHTVSKEWSALRFTPYWNDPLLPVKKYKTRGFVVAGLASLPKQSIKCYVSDYTLHNTYSEFTGAFQLKDNFLIHAGPPNLANTGWGGAGCVEIIGNFDQFRKDIMELAGCTLPHIPDAMREIIRLRKLYVVMQSAAKPLLIQTGEF